MSDISSRAVLNALYAIHGELATLNQLISLEETPEDERDAAAEHVLELTATFGEFAALYKERQAKNATLPPFSELF